MVTTKLKIELIARLDKSSCRKKRSWLSWLAIVSMAGLTIACARLAPEPHAPHAQHTRLTTLDGQTPLIIAHRGASGYLPEETLEAYLLAIESGADAIEMDLVSTRDGVLITRHDANLALSTNVASQSQFASRRKTDLIGQQKQTGWFSQDFTLAEVQTLRANTNQAGGADRPQQFNGLYAIPTFQEVVDLAKTASISGRSVAIYVETKDPAYFRELGLPLEEKLTGIINAQGWNSPEAPVFVQSFDRDSLQRMRAMGLKVRMVQLLGGKSHSAKTIQAELEFIKTYADGIGPARRFVEGASTLIDDAHKAGLFVHPYTYNQPDDDMDAAYRLGVDGVFTDFADKALASRTHYLNEIKPLKPSK